MHGRQIRGWSILWVVCCISCSSPDKAAELTTLSEWRLGPDPIFDASGLASDGDAFFGRIQTGAILQDGSVAVLDTYLKQLILIDSTGHLLDRVGREGEGPGEFMSPWWSDACGDSLMVYDSFRMSVFTEQGEFVRTFRVPASVSDTIPPLGIECSPTRFALHRMPGDWGRSRDESGQFLFHHSDMVVADRSGAVGSNLGSLPLGEVRAVPRYTSYALNDNYLVATSRNNTALTLVDVETGARDTLPLAFEPRPLEPAHIDAQIDQLVSSLPGADMRADMSERLHAEPMPEFAPTTGDVFLDGDLIWVELSIPGDNYTWLRSIRTDGTLVADLRMERHVRVLDIRNNRLLGTYEDASGEIHLVAFRFAAD